VRGEIYDYEERLKRYRRIIAGFGHNGEVALRLLDHLASLRLSKAASHRFRFSSATGTSG